MAAAIIYRAAGARFDRWREMSPRRIISSIDLFLRRYNGGLYAALYIFRRPQERLFKSILRHTLAVMLAAVLFMAILRLETRSAVLKQNCNCGKYRRTNR